MNKLSAQGNDLLISVVMPVFNGEKYLAEAMDSVLGQSYPAFEFIIVDDGSTDSSSDVVRRYSDQVTYVFKEHSGIGATLNRGISIVQGNYIAFLDADDLWLENKLALQVFAIHNSNVDMIFGHVQQFVSPELAEEDKSKLHCADEPLPGYSRDTIFVKKETFFQVGLFSSNYQVGEFIDWYMRAKNLGIKSVMLPDIVAKRRLHKTNTTGQDARIKKDYVRVLKAGLDRRRAQK